MRATVEPTAPARPQQRRATAQRVERILRWTPRLLTLRVAKPAGFRFAPGHYARIGLPAGDARAAWRPYSFVSAPADASLEFLVTLVPGGELGARLALLAEGDDVMLEPAAMGFFVERELAPGDTLWMLATGTGVGPYVSMLRDGGVARRWRRIVVVHSVRSASELAYEAELDAAAASSGSALRYLPVVTRDRGARALGERIPALVAAGTLEDAAGAALEPARSRAMVCGNPAFTGEMRGLLAARGFAPCRRAAPGTMLFENYW